MIVVSGIYDCPGFALVDYVANYLSKILPNFKVNRIVQSKEQWLSWLQETCEQSKWDHSASPLVWKELTRRGGDALYIGGVDQFLEYCNEYYGTAFYQDKLKGKNLAKENVEKYSADREAKALQQSLKCRVVCVTGATSYSRLLVSQLLLLPELALAGGTTLILCDSSTSPTSTAQLHQLAADLDKLGVPAGMNSAVVASELQVAVKSCDLFLILGGIPRRADQSLGDFLEENRVHTTELAQTFDTFAPAECRVIVAAGNDTPTCFNATVFAGQLRHHSVENVVVVTADLGLAALPVVSRVTGLPVSDMAVPPVWGFVGIDHFVDTHMMLHRQVVFEPNKRVVNAQKDSKLPLGTFRMVVRHTGPLLMGHDVHSQITTDTELQPDGGVAKARATVDLLKFWYSEDSDREILCAGVMSDGTFGIPQGTVFSQPVSLQGGCWRPEPLFPAPGPHVGLARLVAAASRTLRIVGLWPDKDPQVPEEEHDDGLAREKAVAALARSYQDPDWQDWLPRLGPVTQHLVEKAREEAEAETLKKLQEVEAERLKKLQEAEIRREDADAQLDPAELENKEDQVT